MNVKKIDLFCVAVEADELDVVKLMIKKYDIVDFNFMMEYFRKNDIYTLSKIIKYFPLNSTYYCSVGMKMTNNGPCFRMFNPLRYAIRKQCDDTTIKYLLKHGATLFTDTREKW